MDSPLRRITLLLPPVDFGALRELASQEERTPAQQATFLVRHALRTPAQPDTFQADKPSDGHQLDGTHAD